MILILTTIFFSFSFIGKLSHSIYSYISWKVIAKLYLTHCFQYSLYYWVKLWWNPPNHVSPILYIVWPIFKIVRLTWIFSECVRKCVPALPVYKYILGHMWPIKRDSQRIPAFKQTNLMRSPLLSREMKPIFALFIVFSLLLVSFHEAALWNFFYIFSKVSLKHASNPSDNLVVFEIWTSKFTICCSWIITFLFSIFFLK